MTWHSFIGLSNIKTDVTKKSLNGYQTLFLLRGWGLGVRLAWKEITMYVVGKTENFTMMINLEEKNVIFNTR